MLGHDPQWFERYCTCPYTLAKPILRSHFGASQLVQVGWIFLDYVPVHLNRKNHSLQKLNFI